MKSLFYHQKYLVSTIFLAFLFLFFLNIPLAFGQYVEKKEKIEKKEKQKGYVDYKPTYTQWDRQYILDKIEYRPQRTVFFFRYLGNPSEETIFGKSNPFTNLSLFGTGTDSSWVIANPVNPRENYSMIEVLNVRRNGVMAYEKLEHRQQVDFTLEGKKYEVVTCEIHFPKLPNDMKEGDLLEGWRYKMRTNHFHCLNIQLKTQNDDIGTYQDMVTRINRFETRYFGWARSEQANILPPEFPEKETFKLPDETKKEEKIVKNEVKIDRKKEEKKKEEKKKKERPLEAQAQIKDENLLRQR